MRFLNLTALTFLFFLLAMPVQDSHAQSQDASHAHAALLSATNGIKGENSVFIGVDIKLDPGWKTYWRMPGDAGLPPDFNWGGSKNVKSTRIMYPAPHRFVVGGFDNFGYKDHVLFPVMILPENNGQPLSVRLKLAILACNEICVPESFDLSLDLPADAPSPTPDAEIISKFMQQVPVTVAPDALAPQKLWLASGKPGLELSVKAAEKPSELDVFVENKDQHIFGKPDYEFDAAQKDLHIHIPLNSKVASIDALEKSLNKNPPVVTVVTGILNVEKEMPLSPPPSAALSTSNPTPGTSAPPVTLGLVILAFLGGLILNLMPCVLPVLSLKVLSALHLGAQEKREAKMGFMAGAFGIMTSFWLLAGILAGLKSAGMAVGWGIQFQHPAFLGFLIAVILLFSINLAGFFEIPLPRFIADRLGSGDHRHPTLTGHFLTGMFATLLATPCTAPFLGTAVGFALTSGTAEIFAIFSFMGLGLAFPWILFALVPGLTRFLPRPGHWMVNLKRFLALALFATALWLSSVLIAVEWPKDAAANLPAGWAAFDEEKVKTDANNGRVILVDVTADWCLSCKVNKKFILESRAVQAELDKKHAVLMMGDWTRKDEELRKYLEKHGRFGIPFNIVYGPYAPDGIVLPELLTEKTVIDALNKATGAQ